MLWCTCCIENNIGYIFTTKWMNTIIYIISFAFVTIESGNTEVCLYQSWFDIGDSYACNKNTYTFKITFHAYGIYFL